MRDRELQDLQREIAQLGGGRGRRLPEALRRRIAAWATRRRAQDAWWSDIARELGVSATTLRRVSDRRRAGGVALVPVDVVVEAPSAATVTLVAPTGWRVEGASVEVAIAILRGLT